MIPIKSLTFPWSPTEASRTKVVASSPEFVFITNNTEQAERSLYWPVAKPQSAFN